jgi:exosortase
MNTAGVFKTRANFSAFATVVAASWCVTFFQLSLAWSSSPNYSFGYLVPLIAVLLFLRRIELTPAGPLPAPPVQRIGGLTLWVILLAAWAFFLFAEIVRQIDPEWRLVDWMMIVSVTILSVAFLLHSGGVALLRRLSFPLLFTWVAVPWPTGIETSVTVQLRTFVTSSTVLATHLLGIDAIHQGDIIYSNGQSIMIDSACSGISSLQATLMASLFLGEFFQFRALWRVLLIFLGILFALAANLARTTSLVLLAVKGGVESMSAWHDRLGYAETCAIFLALLISSLLLARIRPPRRIKAGNSGPFNSPRQLPSPAGLGIGTGNLGFTALAAFASLPLGTWGWFAVRPGGGIQYQHAPLWTVSPARMEPGWQLTPLSIPQLDASTLGCTEVQSASVSGPLSAEVDDFFWEGQAVPEFYHYPDVCMEAGGWKKETPPFSITMRIKDAKFPCDVYRFSHNGAEVLVFQSVWCGGVPVAARQSRLSLLWGQPSRRGLEALNIYVERPGATAQAVTLAEAILSQVLLPAHGR